MAGLRLRPGAAHHELMSEIQLIDPALYRSLIERARKSPRLRINHNFHSSMEDNPHRFLNVMLKGTYIAPHRHLDPPKSESFLVLEGEIAFFTFDDAGRIVGTHILGRDAVGIDAPPGVWHTLVPLTDHAICYEVKPGPYVAATDKEFAAWAPAEGDAAAGEYVQTLLRECRADEGVY
jgi:cupin fold WbuC family metalloprotein